MTRGWNHRLLESNWPIGYLTIGLLSICGKPSVTPLIYLSRSGSCLQLLWAYGAKLWHPLRTAIYSPDAALPELIATTRNPKEEETHLSASRHL